MRVLLVVASALVLAGCFTTTADFKSDAESFIDGAVADELGVDFTAVNCDQPVGQDVGTRFTCTAIDTDGGTWEFDNLIDEPGEFTVDLSRRP